MNATSPFANFLPGFDFLQGLMRQAGPGLPALHSWLAPSLDPAELEKRIQDLRTVQFWLEQNAKLLGATIQALEVQRMTLTTLQSMNVPLAEMARALQIPVPGAADAAASGLSPDMRSAMAGVMSAAAAARQTARPERALDKGNEADEGDKAEEPEVPTPPAAALPSEPVTDGAAPTSAAPASPRPGTGPQSSPMADPLQWWTTLTQQFGEIAARTVAEGAAVIGPAAGDAPAGKGKGKGSSTDRTGSPAQARMAPITRPSRTAVAQPAKAPKKRSSPNQNATTKKGASKAVAKPAPTSAKASASATSRRRPARGL